MRAEYDFRRGVRGKHAGKTFRAIRDQRSRNSYRAKIERAKKHINDLEGEVQAFLDSNPYRVKKRLNPQIANTHYYFLENIQEVPVSIAMIAGDALFNLRAALDHLAFQLAVANGTTDYRILKKTYFPISESLANYQSDARSKLEGLSKAALRTIDHCKPYRGGNDTLWRLHRLNIIDKHRLLITVGSSVSWHTVPSSLKQPIIDAINANQELPPEAKVSDFRLRPVTRKCPLEEGDVLELAWAPNVIPKTEEEVKFDFEISFNESQIVESEPVVATLTQMLGQIEDLIHKFEPLLR